MRFTFIEQLRLTVDLASLHYKLHYIAKYYGRSANGEILYLIRQEIKAFEKEEGEIALPDTTKGE